MTRILHVIPGLTGGGAERQLTILAAIQAQRGHQVHIAVLRPEIPAQLAESDVQVHYVRAANNYDALMFSRLYHIVQRAQPDMLQTWLTLPDVLGGSIARMRRIPWVLSERSEAAAYPPSWKHRVRVRLARHSQAIVANSEGGADYWTSHGIPRARIAVIPNAVVVPPWPSVPVPLSTAFQGHPLILFAGRLSAEKNPLVLVDALALAFATSNAMALMCGTGPMEHQVAARIREHGMQDRIVLAGHRSDVPALMHQAQLCMAISVFEGNPNVVLEAMAIGCPLVVSDIPAYTRLLDHSCARIVPVQDARTMARAIHEVLQDPHSAAARAAAAKARVANRTPDDLADAYENVYAQLV